MTRRLAALLAASTLFAAALPRVAAGRDIDIERPGDREFIVDEAGVIEPADEVTIVETCDKLLTDTAAPIIVVTIESMAAHGGAGLRIETFAMLLFNQWGIGHERIGKVKLNHGILLLVSTGDRKARIELGAGSGRDHDHLAERIMNERIVPSFKRDDFSGGIAAGVEGLDKLARGFKIPRPARPWWHYALVVGAIALAIWSAMSLAKSGASGWAWVLWAAIFGIVGYLLYRMLTSSRRGGGGFSGGSFGGGFSGGGGASGSW